MTLQIASLTLTLTSAYISTLGTGKAGKGDYPGYNTKLAILLGIGYRYAKLIRVVKMIKVNIYSI